MISAHALREAWPDIPWDEPVFITVVNPHGPDVSVIGCRICIAQIGIKAADILNVLDDPDSELSVWREPEGFIEHMQTAHP